MLYETAARAEEVLGLDVPDLDLPGKRGRVISKGGSTDWVHWQTGAALLLPRMLAGRREGPVFLTARRPARAVAGGDLCPVTGRARLSYRRAEESFELATRPRGCRRPCRRQRPRRTPPAKVSPEGQRRRSLPRRDANRWISAG